MKRLVSVCLLMLCLSLPVFAGHTLPGGYACTCGTAGCIEDYAGECDGHGTTQQGATPNNGTTEITIVMAALLLLLRMKS